MGMGGRHVVVHLEGRLDFHLMRQLALDILETIDTVHHLVSLRIAHSRSAGQRSLGARTVHKEAAAENGQPRQAVASRSPGCGALCTTLGGKHTLYRLQELLKESCQNVLLDVSPGFDQPVYETEFT